MKRLLIPATSPNFKWPYGLYSPNRGEGIWITEVANQFKMFGWEVDIITYSLATVYKPITGINFIQYNNFLEQTSYDAIFGIGGIIDYLPADQKKRIIDRTPLCFGGMFSPRKYQGGRIVPVSPYVKDTVNGYYRLGLGYKEVFDNPRFANKRIILTCKEPLDRNSIKPGGAIEHLQAIIRLTKFGYPVTVLNSNDWEYWSKYSLSTREGLGYSLYKTLCSLPKVKLISSNQPQDIIDKELEESSIMVPLWNISSAHRGIPRGLVSLAWSNLLEFYNEESINMIRQNTNEITEDVIFSRLERFLNDEKFFNDISYHLQTHSGVVDKVKAIEDITSLLNLNV